MGKYMRKAKATGEVAVMEVSQSSLGVRTRAKTLALRKLQKSPSSSPSTSPAVSSSGSYLQLRSRRLEKPPPPPPPKIIASSSGKQRQVVKLGCARNPSGANSNSNSSPGRASQRPRAGHVMQEGSRASDSVEKTEEKPTTTTKTVGAEGGEEEAQGNDAVNGDLLGVEEASFGENVLEFEGRERSTRESTPCSLIRDPDTIRTPGSTTRPTNPAETNRRIQNSSQRHIPTAHEMDEFFAGAEVEQQKHFIDKYNFDPLNDKPLPGRYEWEKVDS